MSIFEFVTVAISIILGLAMARILTAGTDLFLHRKRVRLHWIPMVWATVLVLFVDNLLVANIRAKPD